MSSLTCCYFSHQVHVQNLECGENFLVDAASSRKDKSVCKDALFGCGSDCRSLLVTRPTLCVQQLPVRDLLMQVQTVVLDSELVTLSSWAFRKWPTVPQVYVNGEFIGGCDILVSMSKVRSDLGVITLFFRDGVTGVHVLRLAPVVCSKTAHTEHLLCLGFTSVSFVRCLQSLQSHNLVSYSWSTNMLWEMKETLLKGSGFFLADGGAGDHPRRC